MYSFGKATSYCNNTANSIHRKADISFGQTAIYAPSHWSGTGESPKLTIKDARGIDWTVKLGEEAQAETVATRLVCSVGYFAEEAYYFDQAEIQNLPRLSRGRDYVAEGGIVRGARFEPKRLHLTKGPSWEWQNNPFNGTRQLSGLKVLMVLLNNFDARQENNQIFYVAASQPGRREAISKTLADIGTWNWLAYTTKVSSLVMKATPVLCYLRFQQEYFHLSVN